MNDFKPGLPKFGKECDALVIEYRCPNCGKLFFKSEHATGTADIRCERCTKKQRVPVMVKIDLQTGKPVENQSGM